MSKLTANTTVYKGFEIVRTRDCWMVINEYGSGHNCESMADAKEMIDNWTK